MTDTYEVKVRPEKAEAVEAIRSELEGANAAVITEYRGLTVEELKVLRSQLAEQDSTYRVTKKTLARRAADALGLDLESVLEGPIAVAYVRGDPVAAAKIIATFAKTHPALVIKAGVLDGKVLSDQQTKDLATVDSLDVSRAKIMGLLTAPLQATMMLLEAPAARIIFVLEELGKREGGSAEASAPDAAPEAPDVQATPEPEAEASPPAEPKAEQAEEPAEATAETEEAPAEATAETQEETTQEETKEEGE
jgi:large subunit ribosomal protein L10